jgi:16S rRNA processing protein RimM
MNTLAQHNAVLNNAEEDTNLLCIAAVFGAAGVRGAVRLKVFTTDIKSISDFGPVTLFARGSKDARKIKVKFLHNVKGGVAVKLEGVDDRDQAEALKGAKLYIERDILPKIEEKEDFYFEDLVGLIVKDQLGQIFGEVDGVFNFGAGDIIEVKFTWKK